MASLTLLMFIILKFLTKIECHEQAEKTSSVEISIVRALCGNCFLENIQLEIFRRSFFSCKE